MARPHSRRLIVSPSWTKRFPVAPSVMAGIAIGRDQVCAVVLDARGGKHEMRAIQTHNMPVALFSGQPTAETEAGLADALHAVSDAFKKAFASVHVALPDTAIRSTVFELDELPKTDDMRNSLLRWRFAREWQRPEDSLDCRGFDLGEDRGRRLFFGPSGDRPWLA